MGLTRIAAAAVAVGALAGLGGLILGAYAAHGAAPELRPGLETAALYALIHGLALMAAALIYDRNGPGHFGRGPSALETTRRWIIGLSMLAFALGTLFFSGGIFLAALGHNFGTAPMGGVLLMAGWAGLALAALVLLLRRRR